MTQNACFPETWSRGFLGSDQIKSLIRWTNLVLRRLHSTAKCNGDVRSIVVEGLVRYQHSKCSSRAISQYN